MIRRVRRLKLSVCRQVHLERLRRRHGLFYIFAGGSHLRDRSAQCGMHRHEALDDFLEVFPLLLVSVVVAIGVDFGRKALKIYSHGA